MNKNHFNLRLLAVVLAFSAITAPELRAAGNSISEIGAIHDFHANPSELSFHTMLDFVASDPANEILSTELQTVAQDFLDFTVSASIDPGLLMMSLADARNEESASVLTNNQQRALLLEALGNPLILARLGDKAERIQSLSTKYHEQLSERREKASLSVAEPGARILGDSRIDSLQVNTAAAASPAVFTEGMSPQSERASNIGLRRSEKTPLRDAPAAQDPAQLNRSSNEVRINSDRLAKLDISGYSSDPNDLRQVTHLITWTGEAIKTQDAHGRKVARQIRSELYLVLTQHQPLNLAKSISEIDNLLESFGIIDEDFRDHPAARVFYLSLFSKPEFRQSLIQFGEIQKKITTFDFSEWQNLFLLHAYKLLPRLDHALGGFLFSEWVAGIQSAADTSSVDPERLYLGPQTDWMLYFRQTLERIGAILQQLNSPTIHDEKLGGLPEGLRASFFIYTMLYPTPRALGTINLLTTFPWFLEQGQKAQETIFFCLNYALHIAERTTSSLQSALLNNTVQLILTGITPLTAEILADNISGEAGIENIAINILSLDGDPSYSSWKELALDVLPHEVSHILSGQPVEKKARYFEEEMRAWTVGFVGARGRPPNKREASQHAAYLLTERDINAYRHISDAWQTSPRTFFPYLKQLGFRRLNSLRALSRSSLYQLTESITADEEAPQWGWEGYLTNSPKPQQHEE